MRVTRWQIASRGLRNRCPNCGGPFVFGPRMRLQTVCPNPNCGLRWVRRDGFYLGAMVANYGFTVFCVLPLVLLAASQGWLSRTTAFALALVVAIVVPCFFYKSSWSLWLAFYYYFLPHELPANAAAADDERRVPR